jgi:hypothetical protein
MSTDERHLAIGRAVDEYAQNRRQLAALAQRAQQLASQLQPLSEYLRRFGKEASDGIVPARSALQNLPSVEQMRELVAEMDTAAARRSELRSILRDAGIDTLLL